MLEAKHSGSAIRNPSQALLAFKPRQVLLSQLTTTTTAMKQQRTKILTLNPDQKALLLRSVVRYLDCNGFSKPLKRLIADAHIQDDDWKTCSLILEDMFANYLETCTNADTKFDTSKELDLVTNGTKKEEDDHSCSIEKAVVKKKKTKGGESDGIAALLPCGTTNNSADAAKICREMVADDGLTDLNIELKTKKKSKKLSDSVQGTDQASEQAAKEPTPDTVSEMQPEISSKKKKEKKKKSKYISESLENNVEQEQLDSLPAEKEEKHKSVDLSLGDSDINSKAEVKSKDKKKKSKSSGAIEVPYKEGSTESKPKKEPVLNLEDGIQKEKKDSKKRKRLASDEEDTGTPYTNGDLENGDLSAGQESRRKERNSSAEPKTVNAFQRVKIDEVKFADERLQDNSYWAKDGAEVGYGAKAQEVLGQVRGRDFRHEKTKKKRGSYRGGQIDLHSHSVKFNYSDEE